MIGGISIVCAATVLLLLTVQTNGQYGAALGRGAVGFYSRTGPFGESESASSLGGAPVGIYSQRRWSPKVYRSYPIRYPDYYQPQPYYKPLYPVYPVSPYGRPPISPPRPRPPRPGPRPPRPGGYRPPYPGRPRPPYRPGPVQGRSGGLLGGLLGTGIGGGGLLGGLGE